jgi:hypothetical protein
MIGPAAGVSGQVTGKVASPLSPGDTAPTSDVDDEMPRRYPGATQRLYTWGWRTLPGRMNGSYSRKPTVLDRHHAGVNEQPAQGPAGVRRIRVQECRREPGPTRSQNSDIVANPEFPKIRRVRFCRQACERSDHDRGATHPTPGSFWSRDHEARRSSVAHLGVRSLTCIGRRRLQRSRRLAFTLFDPPPFVPVHAAYLVRFLVNPLSTRVCIL